MYLVHKSIAIVSIDAANADICHQMHAFPIFFALLSDTFQFKFGFTVTSILIAENAIGKMSWPVLFSHNFFILLLAVGKGEGVGDLRVHFRRDLNMF